MNLKMGTEADIGKKSVIWNAVFSILSALQSAVLTMAATRLVGADEAGMISIAFAAGYLAGMMAGFGVRNFQVTDTEKRYSFQEYLICRAVTGTAALAAVLLFSVCKGYDEEKLFCVWSVCLLKAVEAFEDLYHGELQRIGRLDAACRMGTVRLTVNYITFFWMLVSGKEILWSISFMAVQSLVIVVLEHIFLYKTIHDKCHTERVSLMKCQRILSECFPLFLMNFFNIYICNSPKYAIDRCMQDDAQAYFAALFMPVFSINLLSGMIYRPRMVTLSVLWNADSGSIRRFSAVIVRQGMGIFALTVFISICGQAVGLKVLEALYGLSLKGYWCEFAVLLAGGGMAAFYNYLAACLTIMRRQSVMVGISIAAACTALVISEGLVSYGGLKGAAVLYLVLMGAEMLPAVVAVKRNIHRQKYLFEMGKNR